jgi:hypothetical protein
MLYRTSVQTTSSRLFRAKRRFSEYFHRRKQHIRMIQTSANANNSPYYRINDTDILGKPDVNAAVGNPLKGLAGGPRYSQSSPLPNSVPSAIEFYNIALDEIMIGNIQFTWMLHVRENASRKMIFFKYKIR